MSKAITKDTPKIEREFNGLTDCLKKISKTEGISGLYKGFTLAIVTAMTYRALYFGLFDNFKYLYSYQPLHDQEQTKPPVLLELFFAQVIFMKINSR